MGLYDWGLIEGGQKWKTLGGSCAQWLLPLCSIFTACLWDCVGVWDCFHLVVKLCVWGEQAAVIQMRRVRYETRRADVDVNVMQM